MHTALAVFRPPRLTRRRAFGACVGLLCVVAGCHDTLTAPSTGPLVPPRATADLLDSPSSGSAEFSVSGEAPLAGNQQLVGHFPTPTVVAMTVHQDFAITMLPPHPPENGRLGLAGRVYGFGCSHQGEAFLIEYPDDGGYGLPFAGCQLAGAPDAVTSFSDTLLVSGMLYYGYGFDAACPYPDAACASYTGSSGVSLARPSATLAIGGDSVRAGVLRAFPNREYTLEAAPSPQRLGRFDTPVQPVGTGWTFTSDSGIVSADVCDNGSGRTCSRTFTQSGELTLVAIVNGERMTSSPLRVQLPQLTLVLSRDSVKVGDTVFATTTVKGIDTTALSYYFLSVAGTGGQVPHGSPGSGPTRDGVPPCIGTRPVPTHCYVVLTQAGRMQLEAGAFLDRRGLGVFDSRAIVVTGDERRVRLSVARSTIVPTARYWRFDPVTGAYTPHPTRKPDTSRTMLGVSVVDAAGAAVPNVDVVLSLAAHDLTAGHDHSGGKPTGILQTLQQAEVPGGRVNTGPTGVAKVNFVASEVSGPVTITGTSANVTRDTLTVHVKVSGLVPLAAGPHYVFDGAIAERHVDNHYGTPPALHAFQVFADSVSDWIHEPIGINDISLAEGGLFDVGEESRWTPWELPHGYHRLGTHADIRIRHGNGTVYSRELKRQMKDLWHVTLDFGVPVSEGDHLHLNFYAP
jgi:hypothetical protein